jgi:dTDP-4-amino-4,6-dideoxygalactose transaminase
MRRIPLFDIKAQHRSVGDRDRLPWIFCEVLDSGSFILGEHVEIFESALVGHLGGGCFAVGVGCGTDALLLALKAAKVGPGDEVITTGHSFLATGNAIIRSGARPVFVDVERYTFNIDPDLIKRAITVRTAAIMPVHLLGRPADMRRIHQIAEDYGLTVIGDAAQAFGASAADATPVGRLAEMECFSTFPTKPLGGMGDGGFVITTNVHLANRLRMLRRQGCATKFVGSEVGFNSRLDALQAAVLREKLHHVRGWRAHRERIAWCYQKAFRGLPVTTQTDHIGHAWHCFAVICQQREDRDELQAHLEADNISTAVHYPVAMCKQPSFKPYWADCPEAEHLCECGVSIPIYAELTDSQVQHIIGSVTRFFERRS